MPVIRVMNWNIESLSINKLNIPGMATAIARTVTAANVDVLIALEVKITRVRAAMLALSTELNAVAGGNNWRGYFLSYSSGKERYCVFIRNLNLIRPVLPSTGPPGDAVNRLIDLHENTFEAWPDADFGVNAYPLGPAPRPIPLLDVYATRRPARQAKKGAGFGGQPISLAGYSLGRGYRLPALLLLMIHTGAADYLVPIVMCHYASSRSESNLLAASQVAQLKDLHIAQLYDLHPPPAPPPGLPVPGAPVLPPVPGTSGYLDVVNAHGANTAVRVQELAFTGDFNLDYLQNFNGGTPQQQQIYNAYSWLTPTTAGGGSAGPAFAPAAPGPVPPVLPFPAPFGPGPLSADVGLQALRAAATAQGTIMWPVPDAIRVGPPVGGPPPAPFTSKALDNFIYGGTQLSTAAVPAGAIDSGQVINVPANIRNAFAAVAPGDIDLSGPANHHWMVGTRYAVNAPNLQAPAGPATALDDYDRWIGARMVSDHLPVVLGFTCP